MQMEKPEKGPSVRQMKGEYKFEQRYARLGRLYQLENTPPILIAQEALMVLDAVRLMYPEEVALAEGSRRLEPLLRAAGLCTACERELPETHRDDICKECSTPED